MDSSLVLRVPNIMGIRMASYVVFVIISLLIDQVNSDESSEPYKCQCGISNSQTERIIGGVDASQHEFPWHAAILTQTGRMFCGATLLNSLYILTAAHCTADLKADSISVILGEHYYKIKSPLRIQIAEIINHPQYKAVDYFNDIALLKMTRHVTFTRKVHPPCLPKTGIDYTGALATVIGWGQISEAGGYPEVLQKVNVPLISYEACVERYGKKAVLPTMICGGWKEGGKDSCVGDSGGPLLLQQNSRWNIIGIVSWGHGCAWANFPAAYTRIDKYLKWIEVNSKDGNPCGG